MTSGLVKEILVCGIEIQMVPLHMFQLTGATALLVFLHLIKRLIKISRSNTFISLPLLMVTKILESSDCKGHPHYNVCKMHSCTYFPVLIATLQNYQILSKMNLNVREQD